LHLCIARKKHKTSTTDAEETIGDPSLLSESGVMSVCDPLSCVKNASSDNMETDGDSSPMLSYADAEKAIGDPSLLSAAGVMSVCDLLSCIKNSSSDAEETISEETINDLSPMSSSTDVETIGDPSLLPGAGVMSVCDPLSCVNNFSGDAEETIGGDSVKPASDFAPTPIPVLGSGDNTSSLHTLVSDLLMKFKSSDLPLDNLFLVPGGLFQRILELGTVFIFILMSIGCLEG